MAEFGFLEGDCATDFYCAGGAAEAVPAGFHRYILLNPHGRGEANRTPASGFGDRSSTTKLLPYIMVGQRGIEPPSSGFSDRRSDLLTAPTSYEVGFLGRGLALPWFCPEGGIPKRTSKTAARDAEASQQQRLPGILSQELIALHGAYAPLPCKQGPACRV